jgi:hypothetical protein
MSESAIDWSKIKLVWHGDVPNIPDLEKTILDDCEGSLWGLSKASSLIFHHVLLGSTYNEHVIHVWGEEGDEDALHVMYEEKVEWKGEFE